MCYAFCAEPGASPRLSKQTALGISCPLWAAVGARSAITVSAIDAIAVSTVGTVAVSTCLAQEFDV